MNITRKRYTKKLYGGNTNQYKEYIEECVEELGYTNSTTMLKSSTHNYKNDWYFMPFITDEVRPLHVHFYKSGGCGYPSGSDNRLPNQITESNYRNIDNTLIQWSNEAVNPENSVIWKNIVGCLRNKIRLSLGKLTVEDEEEIERLRILRAREQDDINRYYTVKQQEFNEIIHRISSVLDDVKLNLVIKTIIYPRINLILCESTLRTTFGMISSGNRVGKDVLDLYYQLISGIEPYVDNNFTYMNADEKSIFKYLMLLKFCNDGFKSRLDTDLSHYTSYYELLKERLDEDNITIHYVRTLIHSVGSIRNRSHVISNTINLSKNIKSVVRRAKRIVRSRINRTINKHSSVRVSANSSAKTVIEKLNKTLKTIERTTKR